MHKFARVTAVAAPLVLFASSSFAAVDAGVTTAMAAVGADAATLAGIVTPIVIAVLGLALGIKLIKRFGNKI